ncbi:type II secretion system protein [Helicobacter aurati]|uniref:Type II secretion system protein n=2 Tax=Helicobacter aurati TaxID=137778 RepID=A0A3D8J0Z1_9HELI|nr:type II secretion system protein [Helicobacter aurati]
MAQSNFPCDTKMFFNPHVKPAFSMMELLFVIVILGILASLALPRLRFSRTNALSVAIQSDIQTIITNIQEYAIINEILPQNANPQWIVSSLHLSPQRWAVSGDTIKIAKNGKVDSQNDCVSIRFDGIDYLQILFNHNIKSSLCEHLLKNYNGDILIPLNIAL